MDCKNLDEVRSNIDRLDNEIIKFIAERGSFIRQAAKFKKDGGDVEAPQRVEAVIQKTRLLARKYGANPDMIEKLYRDMKQDLSVLKCLNLRIKNEENMGLIDKKKHYMIYIF